MPENYFILDWNVFINWELFTCDCGSMLFYKPSSGILTKFYHVVACEECDTVHIFPKE